MTVETILASIFVNAPPERVYDYFTRPDAIVRWIGEYALLEPHRQGRFHLDIRGTPVRGCYLELEPPHRLVISWGYAGSDALPPGESTVEIRLTAEHDGTRVEVQHRDLPGEQTPAHRLGWEHYLSRMRSAINGGVAGPDPGMPMADQQTASSLNPNTAATASAFVVDTHHRSPRSSSTALAC